ncbi:hypothetical protein ACEPAG_1111 [Sanghuangporus baumii]
MDVPYNKSGASSREHYQIVRNVENAPHRTEHLVRHEVQRIRQHISSKVLSTSELRKELIILLYCLNSSFGSINSKSLAFALPLAVHLAEAGSKTSEKRMGYLFCWEVMPRDHELQLMLVNTVRKDLMSSFVARINLALESLVNLPSSDVVPAVQTRCIELLSHPSPRIRALAMHALQSLAQFTADLLTDEVKDIVFKRLSDADESVVRIALEFGLSLVDAKLLETKKFMHSCISLMTQFADKHTTRSHSSNFMISVLGTISELYDKEEPKSKNDYAFEFLPLVLAILRRSVKYDKKSLILECFRFLGRFPSASIARYIIKSSSQSPELHQQGEGSDKPLPHFVHPIVRIRHFLSSRTLNDHYLFLSCLVCLDPSLWAGTTPPAEKLLSTAEGEQNNGDNSTETNAIPLVLDQLEVERVLSFLESEDEQIRTLTLRILISLDPSLVETCYTRTLDALRTFRSRHSTSDRVRNTLLRRLVELAFTITLDNEKIEAGNRGHLLLDKLRQVIDAAGVGNSVGGTIVEAILNRVRRENASLQHSFTLSLLSLLQTDDAEHQQPETRPINLTLFLVLVALLSELAPDLASSKAEVVSIICLFAVTLHTSPMTMQEPLLLSMTRLVILLSENELSSLEIEDVRRVVHELGEMALMDKSKVALIKRCEQFERAFSEPGVLREVLGSQANVSLPEFAVILDQAYRRASLSPNASPVGLPSPSSNVSSPKSNFVGSPPLSHSKLRYDAYAPPLPPPTSIRLHRIHSQSSTSSNRSSNRASSRASNSRITVDDDAELAKTVTAGELTLAAGAGNEFTNAYRSKKSKMPSLEHSTRNLTLTDEATNVSTSLLSLDSPFLPEPLVDLKDSMAEISARPPKSLTASGGTPPYVSASTSLRTSPEPGQNFEALWSELDVFSARGWCEDAVDVVVRRLQGLGLRMDVLEADVLPFEGDLKISLRGSPVELVTPSVALRLHEEGDGSCLWQARSSDRELGLRVKELMK